MIMDGIMINKLRKKNSIKPNTNANEELKQNVLGLLSNVLIC